MKAVDTNVLVYALDADVPSKRDTARELLRELGRDQKPILIWQVAVELLACLRRWENTRGVSPQKSRRYFHAVVRNMEIIVPSIPILDRSFGLRDRYSLSHWDSTLIAACAEASIETLFSEDMTDGAVYDSVTIVNPFTAAS